MINPIHLRTLLETLRLGSFAAAANRLGYTASAVSQQMAALERAVGVPLFERSGRSAHPTEAATAMARHSVRVLADIDALMAATSSAHGAITMELRLAVFPSLARPLLAQMQSHPEWETSDLELRLWVADPSPTIREIRAGREFDVALVYQVGKTALTWPQSMRHEWLGDDEYRVVVPTAWGFHAQEPVAIHQLANLSWVVHHPGTSDAAIIDRLFRGHDLRPRTVAHSDDYTVTLQLVAGGLAASFVPELALHRLPEGVTVLTVPELRLARRVFALTPTDGASPATSAFLATVADVLAELGVARTAAS